MNARTLILIGLGALVLYEIMQNQKAAVVPAPVAAAAAPPATAGTIPASTIQQVIGSQPLLTTAVLASGAGVATQAGCATAGGNWGPIPIGYDAGTIGCSFPQPVCEPVCESGPDANGDFWICSNNYPGGPMGFTIGPSRCENIGPAPQAMPIMGTSLPGGPQGALPL